jgi:hypothetical protein
VQETKRSGGRRASKNAARSMHARSSDASTRSRKTVRKLCNHPKGVSARYYSLQHLERSRIVVLRVPVVVLLHLSLHGSRAPTRPAAAESQHFTINLKLGTLSHRSIEYSTRKTCDNSYCVWLYSLKFEWVIMRPRVHHGVGHGKVAPSQRP